MSKSRKKQIEEARLEAYSNCKVVMDDYREKLDIAIKALEYGLSLPGNRFCDSQVFIAQSLTKIKALK